MAHEFETGFFVTEPAWHGLGTVLQDPPTIQEAIVAAGLDWRVELQALTRPDGTEVPSRAVVRSSDQSLLGVVGPDYEPLQNADALAWFQPFIDSGSVRLEAAGSLREGKRVWVLGRVIGSSADVVKRDRVDQFVLLANGHDGTLSIRCGFTAVRVVCQNTLTAAVNDRASKLLRIRHTKNAGEALTQVGHVINVARGDFEATAAQFRYLASKGCDAASLRRYVREVFAIKPSRIIAVNASGEDSAPVSEVPEAADENLCARIVAEVVRLSESGRGTDVVGVKGTYWGAYNSITEYLTHLRGKSQDTRLDGQWFGQSAMLNARALRLATSAAMAA
jgi:phage/plasmid-like protein (TIGR03299 family)